MSLKRKQNRIPTRVPYQITTLLAELGLDYRTKTNMLPKRGHLAKASFWVRFEDQLEFILADAKKRFRELAKRFHPDKPSGSHRKFVYLSAVWDRIRSIFAAKGICE